MFLIIVDTYIRPLLFLAYVMGVGSSHSISP